MGINDFTGNIGEALESVGDSVAQGASSAKNTAAQAINPLQNPQNQNNSFENLTNIPPNSTQAVQDPSVEDLTKLNDSTSQQQHDNQRLNFVRKSLKQQRHDDVYYDPTFNRKNESDNDIRERKEKTEQEEKQKELVLEEQKKEEAPIALSRAQQKIERLPDAG